jgi:methyl-accepting chemotaxis protein
MTETSSGHGGNEGFQLKWTLGKKIGGLTSLLLAFLLLSAGYSSLKIRGMGDEVVEIAEIQIPLSTAISSLEKHQLEQHVLLESLLSGLRREAGVVEDRAKMLTRFEEFDRLIEDDLKKVDVLTGGIHGVSREHVDAYKKLADSLSQLKKERRDFKEHAEQLVVRASGGRLQGVAEQLHQVEKEAEDLDRITESGLETLEAFTEKSAKSAEEHETGALRGNLLLGLFSLFLGGFLSVTLVRQLGRTVAAVSERAKNVSAGNLRMERLAITTTDELGQLAGIFNSMTEGLTEIVQLNRAGTENLNASSAEILASTQQQAASAKEQAAAVHQTTATMEEVRQSGVQIADRAKQVAAEAEATSAITNTGLQSVRDAVHTMEAIREQVEELAENIVALSEKNQAVGDIISTVNDIAEQSKLLALNASIEAAAAGEQGSRFSVVANEMKNLADQAKESTLQVRSILGEIQKGINSAVMQTEEAVKRVESGKQKTDGTEGTIRQMADTTQKSVHAFQQIVAATHQQQIGFEQVTQALQNIRQATEETAAGTSQLEKAVAALNALSQQLRKTVERYKV